MSKLQSIASLFPDVRPNGERLIYYVKSRSGDGEWRVDKERRMGLGQCDCPNFSKGGNRLCWHLRRVNDFMACSEAQRIMQQALEKYGK